MRSPKALRNAPPISVLACQMALVNFRFARHARHMAICDWPTNERPREKLLEKGAAALTDAELLAILLRTGVRGRSALDLARDVLKSFRSLRKLIAADRARFCAVPGLGPARYAEIQAAAEMRSHRAVYGVVGETGNHLAGDDTR